MNNYSTIYNLSVRSKTLHFNRFKKKKNGQNGHFEKEILSLYLKFLQKPITAVHTIL